MTPPIAKLIVLMSAPQPAEPKGWRKEERAPAAPASSFDETAKTGRALAPRRSISRTRASTKTGLPAGRCAR